MSQRKPKIKFIETKEEAPASPTTAAAALYSSWDSAPKHMRGGGASPVDLTHDTDADDTVLRQPASKTNTHTVSFVASEPQAWLSNGDIDEIMKSIWAFYYVPFLLPLGIPIQLHEPTSDAHLLNHFRNADNPHVKNKLLRSPQLQKSVLFVPVNIEGKHWVILIVDGREGINAVYYFCPYGAKMPKAFSDLLPAFYKGFCIFNTEETVQTTEFDCGIWIMIILTRYLLYLYGDHNKTKFLLANNTGGSFFVIKDPARMRKEREKNEQFAAAVRLSYKEELLHIRCQQSSFKEPLRDMECADDDDADDL